MIPSPPAGASDLDSPTTIALRERCFMGEERKPTYVIWASIVAGTQGVAVKVILVRAERLPKNLQWSSGRDSGVGFSPGALSVSPQKTSGINVDP